MHLVQYSAYCVVCSIVLISSGVLTSAGAIPAGVAQYSGDPKTMWHLNEHTTRDKLLQAVANLPYKGGNTMTGQYMSRV